MLQTVKVVPLTGPHLPFKIGAARQDFPFKSQPASHDVCLIIEAEGKTRAETGHHNYHCSSKPN